MKKRPASRNFSKLTPTGPMLPGLWSIFTLILTMILWSDVGWTKTKDEVPTKTGRDIDLSTVVAVLSKSANPNLQDKPDGETALMGAARRGEIALVKLLLDHHANVNAKFKSKICPWLNGWTALMYGSGYLEIVKLLLERGADVNAMALDGNTALRSAASEGNVEVVKILLEKRSRYERNATRRQFGSSGCRVRRTR